MFFTRRLCFADKSKRWKHIFCLILTPTINWFYLFHPSTLVSGYLTVYPFAQIKMPIRNRIRVASNGPYKENMIWNHWNRNNGLKTTVNGESLFKDVRHCNLMQLRQDKRISKARTHTDAIESQMQFGPLSFFERKINIFLRFRLTNTVNIVDRFGWSV